SIISLSIKDATDRASKETFANITNSFSMEINRQVNPGTPRGGQQQRVAIARALVSDAPIILADEPTGNLDSVTAGEIINILKELAQDRNKCVIVVTHSKEVADSADIILELSGKKLKKVNKMNLEVE
ncbi:ATP-binding cassette domain-containing protein, partial [Streptococcus agalactiae]